VKYRKSKSQRDREKKRRERIFQLLISEEWLTESEIAKLLGISRSTVQRDKRKLKRKLKRYWDERNRKLELELFEIVEAMSMS